MSDIVAADTPNGIASAIRHFLPPAWNFHPRHLSALSENTRTLWDSAFVDSIDPMKDRPVLSKKLQGLRDKWLALCVHHHSAELYAYLDAYFLREWYRAMTDAYDINPENAKPEDTVHKAWFDIQLSRWIP